MPYITKPRREQYEEAIQKIVGRLHDQFDNELAGHLNYVFYRIAVEMFKGSRKYFNAAQIMSALDGAKLEFYRRHVGPYEDEKIEAHGDI